MAFKVTESERSLKARKASIKQAAEQKASDAQAVQTQKKAFTIPAALLEIKESTIGENSRRLERIDQTLSNTLAIIADLENEIESMRLSLADQLAEMQQQITTKLDERDRMKVTKSGLVQFMREHNMLQEG